jgi:hypothetical protein
MRLGHSFIVVLVLLAACGGSATNQSPITETTTTGDEANLTIVANAPTTLGATVEQRVLLGLIDPQTNRSLAEPDLSTVAEFTSAAGEVNEVPAEFLWTIPEVRGLYITRFTFDAPGNWTVRLRPQGLPATPATPFSVAAKASVPEVGDQAPPSPTRTSEDEALADITSDPEPDPAFYQLSLDEAFSSGQPTVVVFATPAFCQSATCGPMLDIAKELRPTHPQVNFVHVEVYENLDAPSLNELRTVPAIEEWGFISEPWVYVVDSAGMVSARFEGAMNRSELEKALADLGV